MRGQEETRHLPGAMDERVDGEQRGGVYWIDTDREEVDLTCEWT